MVEALGINLVEIICAIVNFLILFGVLFKFLYKPVNEMFAKRSEFIQNELDAASATNQEAESRLAGYNARMAAIEEEGREIVRNSKIKAEEQAQMILDGAQAEADAIRAKARADMELEREKASAEMRKEIVAIALLAAEKIIEKDIDINGQEEMINGILEQAGSASWQN